MEKTKRKDNHIENKKKLVSTALVWSKNNNKTGFGNKPTLNLTPAKKELKK